jgi:transposase
VAKHHWFKALSEPEAIVAWLNESGLHITKIGIEIGGLARWLYSELRAAGLHAVCIDPRRLRGVTKTMPVKTDRNDARAIAQVMRVGWYTVVHIKGDLSQELRMLLNNRKTLLIKQIDIENEIRGVLRVFGLKLSGRISQATFEQQTNELTDGHPRLAVMLRPMLVARAALREQYGVLHKMVLEIVRREPTCQRLMTIPGVGALTAITFLTTIDDPDRFSTLPRRWRASRSHATQIRIWRNRSEWRYFEVRRCDAQDHTLSGSACTSNPHPALVRVESLGCKGSQATRSSPRSRSGRTKISDRDASNLGRWKRVPMDPRGGDRMIN